MWVRRHWCLQTQGQNIDEQCTSGPKFSCWWCWWFYLLSKTRIQHHIHSALSSMKKEVMFGLPPMWIIFQLFFLDCQSCVFSKSQASGGTMSHGILQQNEQNEHKCCKNWWSHYVVHPSTCGLVMCLLMWVSIQMWVYHQSACNRDDGTDT